MSPPGVEGRVCRARDCPGEKAHWTSFQALAQHGLTRDDAIDVDAIWLRATAVQLAFASRLFHTACWPRVYLRRFRLWLRRRPPVRFRA